MTHSTKAYENTTLSIVALRDKKGDWCQERMVRWYFSDTSRISSPWRLVVSDRGGSRNLAPAKGYKIALKLRGEKYESLQISSGYSPRKRTRCLKRSSILSVTKAEKNSSSDPEIVQENLVNNLYVTFCFFKTKETQSLILWLFYEACRRIDCTSKWEELQIHHVSASNSGLLDSWRHNSIIHVIFSATIICL